MNGCSLWSDRESINDGTADKYSLLIFIFAGDSVQETLADVPSSSIEMHGDVLLVQGLNALTSDNMFVTAPTSESGLSDSPRICAWILRIRHANP